jgi:periplasmic protein TonB
MRSYAQQKSPGRQAMGVGIVVLLHVAIAYFVITALGVQLITKARQDVDTKIIEEVKPPPPDLPPPPPPPPTAAPPPPFIPPPEIVINAPPPPPVVQQATVVAPPAAPPVQHTEAPPAPAVPDRNVSAKPIAGPPLVYPARMVQSGREGSVDVECDVDTEGKTSNCSVISSTGGSAFSDAAMEYVTRAKYAPEIQHGVPVKVRHKWTITFKLNG